MDYNESNLKKYRLVRINMQLLHTLSYSQEVSLSVVVEISDNKIPK